jgi:hypothetical protein
MANDVTLEQIVGPLTVELEQRGFSAVAPREKESLRYEKTGSNFSVSLNQVTRHSENPVLPAIPQNQICFLCEYELPIETESLRGNIQNTFPDSQLSYFLKPNLQKPPFTGRLSAIEIEGTKVKAKYQIDFLTQRTTKEDMVNILVEAITYIADYVSLQCATLQRIKSK